MAQQELTRLELTTEEALDTMSAEAYQETLKQAFQVGAQDGSQRPVVRDKTYDNPDLADDVQRAYTSGWFTTVPQPDA